MSEQGIDVCRWVKLTFPHKMDNRKEKQMTQLTSQQIDMTEARRRIQSLILTAKPSSTT